MKLTPSTVTTIVYEKLNEEVTPRVIIPTSIPASVIRAIDVTEMAPVDRERVAQLHTEYQQYVSGHMATMFNFETWVSHATGEELDLKWRSFLPERLK